MRTRAFVLIAVIAAGCDPATTPTEPEMFVGTTNVRSGLTAEQSGRVLDFTTGDARAGAIVRYESLRIGLEAFQTTSGASGAYSLTMPPGLYRVLIDGVAITTIAVEMTSPRGDLLAGAGNCAAVYGYIIDARAGVPVPGARVAPGVGTNDAGWYRLPLGCGQGPGGTLVLEVTRDGYEPRTLPAGRGGGSGARRLDAGLYRAR